MWKSRLGLVWLMIAIGVVVFSLIIRMIYSGKYDPVLGINMVLIGETKFGVLGFRGEGDMVNMIILPPEMAIESVSGRGKFKIGSLWGVGKLDNRGGEEVMASLSKALGLNITSYIKVKDEQVSVASLGDLLTGWRIRTNLTWWDRLRIFNLVKKLLASGTLIEKSLPRNLLTESVEPDGVTFLVVDNERIYSWASREWINPVILRERATVAIFNNGEVSGKATSWGWMLETVGVRVLEIRKVEKKSQGCRYRLNRQGLELETVKMLEKDFGCKLDDFESIVGSDRVDIEILTG